MNQDTLKPFKTIAGDRTTAAREWHKNGGKVVGYLSNNLPVELIHAAGLLPFHLAGDPDQSTELADQFMEPAFDPITRSVLNRLLRGDFDFVDYLVLPRSHDAYQRLYYYICEINRLHPQKHLPPVYLCNLLHSPRESTAAHNQKKVREFGQWLEKQTGSALTESALGDAIADYNNARQQLAVFNELRAQSPAVTSLLAYSVYAAAQSLPINDFTRALTQFNTALQEEPAPSNATDKPIVLAGNGLDHPALHQWLDELGARVTGDYHALGNQFLVSQVDENKEAFKALSEHYHRETKSTRTFFDNPNELVDFTKQQGANGVLFFYLKREEALTWHYPKEKAAAERAGLKTLGLHEQNYLLEKTGNLSSLQAFLETLS